MRTPVECHVEPGQLPDGQGPRTFCPRESRRYVLVAAILASAMGFIDGTIVSIAMPAIRADIGATLNQAQWISNAYMLFLSALILAGGALGDRFGLRRSFAAGIAVFVAASLACAIAPTPATLIAARAIQGLGAAVMVPGSLAIIAKAYPKAERGRAIGIWAASSALTTALGPVLGGLALSLFPDGVWRAMFAVNLPLGIVTLYLLLARVPPDPVAAARRIDGAGAFLATAGLGSMTLGLTLISEGDALFANAPTVLIVAGIVLLCAFLLWERRHAEPMVKLGLFTLRAFTGANLATFFLYFALSAIMFYLPMLLIAGWRLDETLVGLTYLPITAFIALLSGYVGGLSDRIGPRTPIAVGSLIVAIAFAGLALLAGNGVHSFWAGALPMMTLMGFGMALVVSPLSTAVMTAVEDDDTGAASGINNAVSRVAGLVAVAALGTVAALRFAAVAGAEEIPGFGEPVEDELASAAEALRVAASDAAFSSVAWISALACALAALCAWLTVPGKPASRAGEIPAAEAAR